MAGKGFGIKRFTQFGVEKIEPEFRSVQVHRDVGARRLKSIFAAALLGLVMATVGCSVDFLELATNEPVNLVGASGGCFDELPKQFENYVDGLATEQDIDLAYECVDSAVSLFEQFVRSEAGQRDFYTSGELRTFLKDTFSPTFASNKVVWSEVMKLKRLLVGGDSERIQKSEVKEFRTRLELVRGEAKKLLPWMRYYTFQLSEDEYQAWVKSNPSERQIAQNQAVESASRLLGLLSSSADPYLVSDLKALCTELVQLYGKSSSWPETLLEQVDFIAATKALILDGDGTRFRSVDFQQAGQPIGDALGLALDYYYQLKNEDVFYGDGLQQFESLIGRAAKLVSETIAAKPAQVVTYSVLNRFVTEFTGNVVGEDKRRRFELPITADTIQKILPVILGRLLNPLTVSDSSPVYDERDSESARGRRDPVLGLDQKRLNLALERFQNWVESQRTFEKVEREFKSQNSVTGNRVEVPFSVLKTEWARLHRADNRVEKDLQTLFQMPLLSSTLPDGTMMFRTADRAWMDRLAFREMNWKQVLVRLIGDGYVSNPVRHEYAGLLLHQFETVFLALKALAVDLDFIEPTEETIYKTGFFVSSVFLYSSDGNDRLSFQEAVDLFVLSFGTDAVRKPINDVVAQNCAPIVPTPAGKKPWYRADCWRFQYRLMAPDSFWQIPGWAVDLPDYTDAQWDLLETNLLLAAKQPNSIPGTVQPAEMSRPFSIQLYTEALFVRWDTDQNRILTFDEAERAYPLLYPILKKASELEDADVFAVYAWVLANGKPPTTLGEKARFQARWRRQPKEVWAETARADRLRVAQIFGALAAEISK